MNITPAHPNDVFVWPDDMTGPTWCFREDAHEMAYMSDDYRVLPAESTEAEDFLVREYATTESCRLSQPRPRTFLCRSM